MVASLLRLDKPCLDTPSAKYQKLEARYLILHPWPERPDTPVSYYAFLMASPACMECLDVEQSFVGNKEIKRISASDNLGFVCKRHRA